MWSDGSPVTSADVKFTADYCMDPNGGCAQLEAFDNISSIETPDDRTIVVPLQHADANPYGPFVGGTSYHSKSAVLKTVKEPLRQTALSKTLDLSELVPLW